MTQSRINANKYRLSREQGTVFKDWGGRTPFALIYPNSYYLGMSNLGIQVIYRLLNGYPNIVCERVFREKDDRTDTPLSLESLRPLPDFAVLAFSVTYELDYFNIAAMLKAAGIPLYASQRDERHPLVIAGGPCISANPMPLAPFFDCLCIGEAEVILPRMLPVLTEGLKGDRPGLLKALAKIPGVYLPGHTDKPVKRQWLKELDDFPATSTVLTPDTELGNLYLIEVERGCHWNCRFCLVSNTFSPMRCRSVDKLLAQAEEGLKYRKRIGLVGPAVSEHPHFEELVKGLRRMDAGFSLSSLRIKPFPDFIIDELIKSGAGTITLAPEAGSERLRRVISKGVTEDDIVTAMEKIAGSGLKQLRLYFMIGLPTETDDDIRAIIDLTLRCQTILKRAGSGCRITLSIAPFVPKAGTPFQWLPMTDIATLKKRLSLLKNGLQPRGIKISAESPAWSQVQAILARGGPELAGILADIEEVSLAGWRQALKQRNIDADHHSSQRWDTRGKLPWSVLESGTETGRLERELNNAFTLKK